MRPERFLHGSWNRVFAKLKAVRYRKIAVRIVATLIAVLPLPALMAPYVSDTPVLWAYRVYHPFFYRYPVHFAAIATNAESRLEEIPPLQKSISVAGLIVEHW